MEPYLWLIPLGFAIGAYGTLIGVGGGLVLMPVLLLAYPGDSPDLLTAISLAVVFLNALSGSIAYGRMHRIDYRSGLVMAAAAVPGAAVGAITTAHLPRGAFDLVLGGLMLAVSVFLIWRPQPAAPRAPAPSGGRIPTPAWAGTNRFGTYSARTAVAVSFMVGFISSMLGVGGGIIHVPAMVHLLGFPVHVATATSHFILALTALTGTGVHFAQTDMMAGINRIVGLGIGAVVGAQVGAAISTRIHGNWIIRGLAVVLGLVGIRVLVLAMGM
jgi:uncharacterized membrane protein YfcA